MSQITLSPTTKHLPLNKDGRDFVVGDIHGAFNSVISCMKKVNFNPMMDRLFCTGDLIDRGDDSARAVKFLANPFIHSVMGNHEFEFINASIAELRAAARVNFNGMKWVEKCDDKTLLGIQNALSTLPYVIEVDTPRGVVGIIHAEVPANMRWHDFKEFILDGHSDVIDSCLWGRDRIDKKDNSGVDGIDRLFVGHSIQWDGVRQLGNVFYIDGGGIFAELGLDQGALTMANLICHTEALNGAIGVVPYSGSGLFGQYATIL